MFEETFCLLKSEAYVFNKASFIESKVKNSGLTIVDHWQVKLFYRDTFAMYQGLIPRITMSLRFSPFFKLELFFLEGDGAIDRMYRLKHQIREEIWGWRFQKGGFLHAPDSVTEYNEHKAILRQRKISVKPIIS